MFGEVLRKKCYDKMYLREELCGEVYRVVMIRCVWGKGYVCSVMEFIFFIHLAKIRILNLIHKFHKFNLPNCHIFVKQFLVISLNRRPFSTFFT